MIDITEYTFYNDIVCYLYEAIDSLPESPIGDDQ
jgi:hypothetical protein